MKVEVAGANKYALTFASGEAETLVADRWDRPGLVGTTLSITIEGPDTWKVVRKRDGHTLLTAIWKLSEDGETLSDTFSGNQPNGSTFNLDYVLQADVGGLRLPWHVGKHERKGELGLRVSDPALRE
jgi:hypothetical protein